MFVRIEDYWLKESNACITGSGPTGPRSGSCGCYGARLIVCVTCQELSSFIVADMVSTSLPQPDKATHEKDAHVERQSSEMLPRSNPQGIVFMSSFSFRYAKINAAAVEDFHNLSSLRLNSIYRPPNAYYFSRNEHHNPFFRLEIARISSHLTGCWNAERGGNPRSGLGSTSYLPFCTTSV